MATPISVPLHFLPAFELAAQHLSIRRAAEELHLTPSAVSQQIRALEGALGFSLFRRATRALHLTPLGAEYAAVVKETLDTYRQGSERLLKQRGQPALRLSSDSFIAHEVLIPQLHAFREVQRGVDLRIETSNALVDFEREGFDAAVRFGRGPWPGLASSTLCSVLATPVCAPGLLPGGRLPARGNWTRYPLIAFRDYPDPWPVMSKLLGVVLPRERLVFDSYFASIRAAEKGLGIAIGLFPVTSGPVLEGKLITPLNVRVRTHARYHFVCRREDAARPALGTLRKWLKERFAALPFLENPGKTAVRTMDEP
ncbi:MAG: LysR substrate-binding domain-containing protein [Myxococcales bacterium]